VANFLVGWRGVWLGGVVVFLILKLNSMRLWSDSVFSSLTLLFVILWAKSIDEAVISIQLSPVGPE
jgi:hypothetical protein